MNAFSLTPSLCRREIRANDFIQMENELWNVCFKVKFWNPALASTNNNLPNHKSSSKILKPIPGVHCILGSVNWELIPSIKTSQLATMTSFHLLKLSVDLIIHKAPNLRNKEESRTQMEKHIDRLWRCVLRWSIFWKRVDHNLSLWLRFTFRKHSRFLNFV